MIYIKRWLRKQTVHTDEVSENAWSSMFTVALPGKEVVASVEVVVSLVVVITGVVAVIMRVVVVIHKYT